MKILFSFEIEKQFGIGISLDYFSKNDNKYTINYGYRSITLYIIILCFSCSLTLNLK